MIRCPICNRWTPSIEGVCSKCYEEAMEGLPRTTADEAASRLVAHAEEEVLRIAEEIDAHRRVRDLVSPSKESGADG